MATFFGWTGLVIAVIGIAVAIYVWRRPVRRHLVWTSEAVPLFKLGISGVEKLIEVRVAGRTILEPYLLTITIANQGNLDVESSAFDQGLPLKWLIDPGNATLVPDDRMPPNVRHAADILMVGPALLKAKSVWKATLITEGRPRVELLDDQLVNTTVHVTKEPIGQPETFANLFSNALRTPEFVKAVAGLLWAILAILIIRYTSISDYVARVLFRDIGR